MRMPRHRYQYSGSHFAHDWNGDSFPLSTGDGNEHRRALALIDPIISPLFHGVADRA